MGKVNPPDHILDQKTTKPRHPYQIPVRGLNRMQAATYVGISPSKFDQLVNDGRMPKAKKIDTRNVWDLRELDFAFDELTQGGNTGSDWDEAFER